MCSRETLDACWDQALNLEASCPPKIVEWVTWRARVCGVPTSYVLWPLLVAVAHASQHTYVRARSLTSQPTVLYALVVGRSGDYYT